MQMHTNQERCSTVMQSHICPCMPCLHVSPCCRSDQISCWKKQEHCLVNALLSTAGARFDAEFQVQGCRWVGCSLLLPTRFALSSCFAADFAAGLSPESSACKDRSSVLSYSFCGYRLSFVQRIVTLSGVSLHAVIHVAAIKLKHILVIDRKTAVLMSMMRVPHAPSSSLDDIRVHATSTSNG